MHIIQNMYVNIVIYRTWDLQYIYTSTYMILPHLSDSDVSMEIFIVIFFQ